MQVFFILDSSTNLAQQGPKRPKMGRNWKQTIELNFQIQSWQSISVDPKKVLDLIPIPIIAQLPQKGQKGSNWGPIKNNKIWLYFKGKSWQAMGPNIFWQAAGPSNFFELDPYPKNSKVGPKKDKMAPGRN